MTETVVVSGGLAQRPGRAGHAWLFVTWLLALRRLGWTVLFVDRLESEWIGGAVEESAEARWLAEVMARFGLADSWSLLHDSGRQSLGVERSELADRLDDAALLIDVMGFLDDADLRARPRRRAYLDIDPGWTQIWQDTGAHHGLNGYDAHVTVGRNVGTATCSIPDCGIEWIASWPPVLLDEWAANKEPDSSCFTSVATWRGPNDSVEYGGERLGLRAHSFRRIVALPEMVDAEFCIALDIDPEDGADRDLLIESGWQLEDPLKVAGDPDSYRDFVRGSAAELLVPKDLYVTTRSGWFSDRSASYLAAGRPVLALDTGIPRPEGGGLVTFSTLEEARKGVADIQGDPAGHSAAARSFAEEHLDSELVVGGLLERLGAA